MKLTSSPSPSPYDFHCVKWSHKKPPNKQSPGENSSQAQICGWREKKTYNTANANFPHISRPWTRRSTSQTVVRRDLCGFPFSLSPPKPLKNRTRSRGRRFLCAFAIYIFFTSALKKIALMKKKSRKLTELMVNGWKTKRMNKTARLSVSFWPWNSCSSLRKLRQ